MEANKSRLGKGLSALLGENGDLSEIENSQRLTLPITTIQQNPNQPRKDFDDDDLLQLSESIRNHGILQPLIVRVNSGQYELIAGERRFRAAQVVGLTEVPVSVVDFNDQQVLEVALVENIQRTDLNPIEKAQGFKDYLDRFGISQEALANRLGIDRTSVTNLVNLLNLPVEVQTSIRKGEISLGHAKILKGLADPVQQIQLAKEVTLKGLSVKALETLVKQIKEQNNPDSKKESDKDPKNPAEKSPHVIEIEDELRHRFSTRLEIKIKEKDKGQIVISFDSNDDFERILHVLRR